MSDQERTFPFITGDRIRLTSWAEGKHHTAAHPPKWVRVGGYGQVYFIGITDDGTENTYFKDAKMDYNDEWEIYAPAPLPRRAYVEFPPESDRPVNQYLTSELAPEYYGKLPHGATIWECLITPETRIYP